MRDMQVIGRVGATAMHAIYLGILERELQKRHRSAWAPFGPHPFTLYTVIISTKWSAEVIPRVTYVPLGSPS